jgi:glycosyltransferase involved in cell wall biosynthesis
MPPTLRPRVLFVSPRYPFPPWRGDQVRAFHLLDSLREMAEVRLLSFGAAEDEPLPFAEVETRTLRLRPAGRLRANLTTPPRLPGQVRLFLDAAMTRAVAEEIATWKPDVLHLTLARMAPYLPPEASFHRHLDLVDSLALNMRTRAGAHSGPARLAFLAEARLMLAYEARVAAAADSCSVVSEADRRMPGLGGATVIPNGVDLDAFPFEARTGREPVIAFFGNLGYFHNVGPACFLAEEVLPRVRRVEPRARLLLVGARPAVSVQRLADLDGVEVAADVPEMSTALRRAAVAALPSFSGSGIKNKVLEAFCAGLPVVSNRLGVQGVAGATAGEHYLPAEDADEVAAAALKLFGDSGLGADLATAAHRLIGERYSWRRQAELLMELYGFAAVEGTGSALRRE